MPDELTVADEAIALEPTEETAAEEVVEDDSPEAEVVEGGEPEDGDAEPEIEQIELRYGSNALNIPKGALADDEVAKLDAFLQDTQADYTRKTQDVAEQRRANEQAKQTLDQLSNLNETLLGDFTRGQQVKNEIERLSQVNLNQLWQSDPDQARQVSDQLAVLNGEFQQTIAKVQQGEADLLAAQESERSRRIESGRAAVEKLDPGFAEKLPEVLDYVSSFGVDRAEAERDWPLNPAMAVLAKKAMLYDRMQAKAGGKPAVKPAEAIKPTKGRGARATVDPDKLSMDEWVARRRKQLAG